MPNRRDLMLEKYDISKARQDELRAFCRQYEEKKSKLDQLYELSSASGGGVDGGKVGMPTEAKALKAIKYREDIEKIDEALDYASALYGDWMRKALYENIIKGVRFYQLKLYCDRRKFYDTRHIFYEKLDSLI